MAIHPRGAASLTPDQVERLALHSSVAHSLAILSFFVLSLGACGLVRRIAAADRIAFAAIVTYGFACVAVLIAAAVSGFVIPDIMRHMVRDVPANAQQWKIVISSVFQINQAFSRIYSVAASVAIILWSVSGLRNGGLGRRLATYGCIIGPLIILGIFAGHLRLDVHGMAVVASGHAVWFIMAGVQLVGGEANLRPTGAIRLNLARNNAMRIDHVAHPCRNPRESHRFYNTVLGLTLVQAFAAKELMLVYALPDGGSLVFTTTADDFPHDNAERWEQQHVGLTVETQEEFDRWLRRLKECGITHRLVDQERIYFSDPDGLVLEIEVASPMKADPAAFDILTRWQSESR